MKALLTNAFWMAFLYLSGACAAQNPVPNPGFERWTDNLPDDWFTSNLPDHAGDNVTPVNLGYKDNLALKGEVIEGPGTPGLPFIPLLESNTSDFGFPVSQNYPYLSLFYQFHPVQADDKLIINVGIQDDEGSLIGGGSIEITSPADSFTILNLPLAYNTGRPYRAAISITVGTNVPDGLPALGSYFFVDDISMGAGIWQEMDGFIVIGSEVNDFIACGDPIRTYWMEDQTATVNRHYQTYAANPYEPVFAKIIGLRLPTLSLGYASERDGLLLIREIVRLEKKNAGNDCLPKE